MRPEEWPDLLQVDQIILNYAPSSQRKNTSPVTVFTGLDASAPIFTFYGSHSSSVITPFDVQKERVINIAELQSKIAHVHPVVQNGVMAERNRLREAWSREALPNFTDEAFHLVARDEFTAGEKLSLCWRVPRRVIKSIHDYV